MIRGSSWEKDIDFDRYIEDFIGHQGEIWLIGGDPHVYLVPPPHLRDRIRALDEVHLTIHYYRYDQDYEGWNAWVWEGVEPGRQVNFVTEDDFGLVGRTVFYQKTDASDLGMVLRKSVSGSDWYSKDGRADRIIPLYRADDQGHLHIWLMQDDPKVYYRKEDVNRSPSIIQAALDDVRLISVKVNIPVQTRNEDHYGFVLVKEGTETVPIEEAVPYGHFTVGPRELLLITGEDLDLEGEYTLFHPTHGEAEVRFGYIFDSSLFAERFHYPGDDLGVTYTPTATTFRVWAPTAEWVELVTYEKGRGGKGRHFPMERDVHGTWVIALAGDLHGLYYNYLVTHHATTEEAVDPYARACGVNGERGMVVDLVRTNPPDWDRLENPPLKNAVDAVIYELHVRDLSSHPLSGIKHKGKYLGVIEPNTVGPQGVSTGLAHLKELGVTHVHLMPVFDFATVDEEYPEQSYNWGYDPLNYNIPEGSYSTDPKNGQVRIREFKQMVQGLKRAGLRVIMDVVYNHTYESRDSHLNKLVPGYYYRLHPDGTFSNGSGCGNELADERSMVRKMIVDSVRYWAEEFKIDGFRFDLMGLHHIQTMKAVRRALDLIDTDIIIYGEGWSAGGSTLPEEVRAGKDNTPKLSGIGSFCNDMRDGIKGHVFHHLEPGFIQGGGLEETVKFGIVGAVYHPQIDYDKVMYSAVPWALKPEQTVVYTESHDNLTLWDKLLCTSKDLEEGERVKMDKLANAIVLTSQGIPFLHAGQEFARTKGGDFNSYQSPDAVNQIDWNRKAEYGQIFSYTKGLITLRKDHPAFRMTDPKEIQSKLIFLSMPAPNMIGFILGPHANGDPWEFIVVLLNGNGIGYEVSIPNKRWTVVVNEERAGCRPLGVVTGPVVYVGGRSCLVLRT